MPAPQRRAHPLLEIITAVNPLPDDLRQALDTIDLLTSCALVEPTRVST
jgi:hypothetical protein